jgi:hypothetical protein
VRKHRTNPGGAGLQEETAFSDASVKYPSDRLTLGYIRGREPGSHTSRAAGFVEYVGPTSIDKILWWEDAVAREAFHEGKGQPPDPEERKAWDELARMYVEYGLAQGMREAREMVNSIERQVKKGIFPGPGRRR